MKTYASTMQSYVICTNPRSGSTYLGALLASTELLGYPWEWLRGDGGLAHHDFATYTADQDEQIDAVIRDGCTPNGICALKMLPEHFDRHSASGWSQRLPGLRYVYLEREDLLGQAISLAIARQTESYGVWAPKRREPIYSAEHIRNCLDFIVMGEARWRAFFAINDINPLRLTYREVVERPQNSVDQIAEMLGVAEAPIRWDRIAVSVQRDDVNASWRKQFVIDRGERTMLASVRHVDNSDTINRPQG